jgi:hypothetical protein
MKQIEDGRRNIMIHGNAEPDEVPVTEFPDLAQIGRDTDFVPMNMDEPKLYTGDVVVGVYDGEIEFADLIYDKVDGAVLVDSLVTSTVTTIDDSEFSRRFFQADEIHIYDDVVRDIAERDVEFDESKIERPETSRAR